MKLLNYYEKFCVGFSFGISFPLTLIILDYWLKDVGVSNSVIGFFTLLHWPFTLKFLWGPFVEHCDIPFFSKRIGRIKSWFLFSNILLICGTIIMAFSNPSCGLFMLVLGASIVAIGDGCKNIALYPYQRSTEQRNNFGNIATFVSLGHRLGMLVIKVGALHIAHFYSWKIAYLFAAICIFILMILIFCLQNHLVYLMSSLGGQQ